MMSANQPAGMVMTARGTPNAIHWMKLMDTPKFCSISVMASTLMIQPEGVMAPPIAAAHGMPMAMHFANADLPPVGVLFASSTP